MAIERKPLKKAPARDVVEAFTANAEVPQAAIPVVEAAPTVTGRGPGRPRSKRRM